MHLMPTTKPVQSATYATQFDQGRHYRAKIGFVLLATEQTIQDDVMALRPDGVGMHFARIATPDNIIGKLSNDFAPITLS